MLSIYEKKVPSFMKPPFPNILLTVKNIVFPMGTFVGTLGMVKTDFAM